MTFGTDAESYWLNWALNYQDTSVSHPNPALGNFGIFMDLSPDRWGQTLVNNPVLQVGVVDTILPKIFRITTATNAWLLGSCVILIIPLLPPISLPLAFLKIINIGHQTGINKVSQLSTCFS